MVLRWCYFACLFLLVALKLELANARFYLNGEDEPVTYKTIVVDPSGQGNFITIQSAIDSVPSNNRRWVLIKVTAGIYREKVKIPFDKPYIALVGEKNRNTIVDGNDHASTAESPTIEFLADNIFVKYMSFRNSYNNPLKINDLASDMAPAVAAKVCGDKIYFYRVGFFGFQDTLWDESGRHYYKYCTIQGAVDFIFGAGHALFERCSISVIDAALGPGRPGYITAHGRNNPNDATGFVFKDCKVFGNGKTYLGRPWRDYARVLFYNTYMSNIIKPTGWEPWHSVGQEDRVTFAEYKNFGPGADTSKRVSWTKKLDLSTINKMASLDFIDDEGWLSTFGAFISG
ncbi:probable pectinesterase 29 [Gastrolobium bilobum]|uniref:probable pectinesterase 29 n=1 Tax=Gastrolobium bilobum TaxID=150636 RepID=UPI002AB0788F|nr:probable pectinesterase 29 [Gastrolobium bilobum]